MPRSLVLACIFLSCAGAAGIWPERLGTYDRKAVQQLPLAGGGANEYGQEATEGADYGRFKVVASRYKDPTGAYAAGLAAPERPLQAGNYLITCTGDCPKDLSSLIGALPGVSYAPLPALANYLPAKGLIARSERYILGPQGLREAAPQIPESAVAFQFGTEGEIARYRTPHGELIMAVFSYPTPQMARQQTPGFEAIPGAAVKRAGPLVLLVLPSNVQNEANAAAARKLLSQITYNASVSRDETPPLVIRPETAGQMLMAIISLAGVVLVFCVVSGLAFAAILAISRRFGYSGADGSMTTLHLSGK
jgi:hypothetical protein